MAQFEAEKTTEWLSGRREPVADSLPAQATYSGNKGNYSGDSSGYSGDTELYSGDRESHSNGKTPYSGDSGPKADNRDAFGRLISPALMGGYHSSALQWAVRHPFLPGRAVAPDTLRLQYLSTMVEDKSLTLAFPQTPNDKRQAYITTRSLQELEE